MHRLPSICLSAVGLLLAACSGITGPGPVAENSYAPVTPAERAYLFAWPDFAEGEVKLRGGTSRGAKVVLREEPSEAWQALRRAGPSDRERDRAAILALAGDYRVSFDFLEIVLFGEARAPSQPYRSWGTERVYVVNDEPDLVQLQHIMVMYFVDDEGETKGPFVQKHWRQDWRYEPAEALHFDGHGQWSRQTVSTEERAGRWLQTVYQVDDTPRYSLLGRWSHEQSHSSWQSSDGWRPLPRREHTIRNDYHALDGSHRITVLPRGWVHEQDQLKRVLAAPRKISPETPARAREIGISRYDRVEGFDFSAGDAYWERTGEFWRVVRDEWDARVAAADLLNIRKECEGRPVFMLLFESAYAVEQGELRDPEAMRESVTRTLDCSTKQG